MAIKKVQINATIRPTTEDWKLIRLLKAKTGLNLTSIVRLALRRLADQENVSAA